MDYFRNLGIETRMDAAGNLIARLEDINLPVIMGGSHLDTVPDDGTYDRALGYLSQPEVFQTLIEAGLPSSAGIWYFTVGGASSS